MRIARRFAGAAAVALAAGSAACADSSTDGAGHAGTASVRTFDECVEAGGRVAMKDPPVCYPGNRSFDEAEGEARAGADAASVHGAAAGEEGPPAADAAVSVTFDSLPEPARRTTPSAHRYQLDPDPGPCEAAIARYYYDRTEQECKAFMWGGCGGVVPFETREECEAGLVPAE